MMPQLSIPFVSVLRGDSQVGASFGGQEGGQFDHFQSCSKIAFQNFCVSDLFWAISSFLTIDLEMHRSRQPIGLFA